MADLAFPTAPAPSVSFIQGRVRSIYASTASVERPGRLLQDPRVFIPQTGVITDQVVLKSGAAEVPYVNGRVWLLRLADGYKAWEGWSDAAGNYTATGLELGVEYVAVAIDPLRNFKTVGAGPVTAV